MEPLSAISPDLVEVAASPAEDGLGTPRTAGPPFNRASADVIIRTADLVDFHVWKCLLAEVSQVFAAMFQPGVIHSDPDASTRLPVSVERVGEKPVIPVTETSHSFRTTPAHVLPPAEYHIL
ncbi:hypothetical protein L226DRAFT_108171 [Lentinus tigrinus ALCF2SS1-7]|uniref:BTB domain-containing protein n=1 Tax=Lentinus tigrinus ALCF2SS1-6 TaxID=1328759 RepID=A0A5C2S7D3_9APHY|nr:hypothetical protein L227DRAFT_549871 [Lentinus tigrinus ALCF2SS1-6]RPD73332.1 hypothetical protein L226DRAFT_108171 [Lentinus tigrinus ALCF2SS1-7]